MPADLADRLDVEAPTPSAAVLTAVPAVAVALVIAAVLWFVIGVFALPVALAAGVAVAVLLPGRSTDAVLRLTQGEPVDPDRDARLVNVVEGMALTGGLTPPDLRIVDDATLNVLAVGEADGAATLVVTRGVIDRLDRVALEGVVAHALCRLHSPAQQAARVRVTTLGLPRYLAEKSGAGPAEPCTDAEQERSRRIDLDAVRLTRYPPGLLAALELMAEHGTTVATATRSTRALWMASPLIDDAADLDLRAATLREL